MSTPKKPGTDNQKPGTYEERGPRGGKVPNPRTVKIDRGDRLPPTQEPNRTWVKKQMVYGEELSQSSLYVYFSFKKTVTFTKQI